MERYVFRFDCGRGTIKWPPYDIPGKFFLSKTVLRVIHMSSAIRSTLVYILQVVTAYEWMFASKLKRRVLTFQGSALASRMADPLKADSDASGSDCGLMAANEGIELTDSVLPHEEHSKIYGNDDELGCSMRSRAATVVAEAEQRSAVRYEENCCMSGSYPNASETLCGSFGV
jgi:hypothetical protein